MKSGTELFVDNTEGFEETGFGKGSSGTEDPLIIHQDPLMNIISGLGGVGVGKELMGKGGGGGVMDLVNMGVNAMAGGGSKGGGAKSPMMDLVNMGINAVAGGSNKVLPILIYDIC